MGEEVFNYQKNRGRTLEKKRRSLSIQVSKKNKQKVRCFRRSIVCLGRKSRRASPKTSQNTTPQIGQTIHTPSVNTLFPLLNS